MAVAKSGKNKNTEKVGFFSKIGKFFSDCRAEMKKIVWTSKKSTIKTTILVIVAIVVVSVFTGIFDYIFSTFINILSSIF